jgi:hypothetical protein
MSVRSIALVVLIFVGLLSGLVTVALAPRATNGPCASGTDWPRQLLHGPPAGITPGQTRLSEALAHLRTLPYVEPASVDTTGRWRTRDGVWGGSLSFDPHQSDPLITAIWMGLPRGLRLGDIIDRYGPPDLIDAVESYGSDGGPVYGIQLIYTEPALVLSNWAVYHDPPAFGDNTCFDLIIFTTSSHLSAVTTAAGVGSPTPWTGLYDFFSYCHATRSGTADVEPCTPASPYRTVVPVAVVSVVALAASGALVLRRRWR